MEQVRHEKSLLPLDKEGNPIILTEERKEKGDIESVYSDEVRGGSEHRSFSFPIDYLHRRGRITGKQHRAGSRLYQLWYHGFSAQYTLMRYGSEGGGGDNYESVRHMAIQYMKAFEAIRGDDQRKTAWEVCCRGSMLSGLSGFASERTARRKALPLLQAALDDLIDHFGFAK